MADVAAGARALDGLDSARRAGWARAFHNERLLIEALALLRMASDHLPDATLDLAADLDDRCTEQVRQSSHERACELRELHDDGLSPSAKQDREGSVVPQPHPEQAVINARGVERCREALARTSPRRP